MKSQKETEALLSKWMQNLSVNCVIHYESAKPLLSGNYLLGIPVAVFSAAIGTSILATLQENVNVNFKIIAGLFSFLSAIFASLQTLLKLNERAEKHRSTGARYSSLIREIEEILALAADGNKITENQVTSIREQYNKISEDAPNTSERMYNRALKSLKND